MATAHASSPSGHGSMGPMGVPAHTSGPAFSSSRVLRFGALSEDEREAFTRFFVDNHVTFFRDVDGAYVANLRLYDPNVIDMTSSTSAPVDTTTGATGTARSKKGKAGEGEPGSRAAADLGGSASALDFSVYERFTSHIAPRDSAKPKVRPLSWLMRQVEEMYDNRFAKDTAELREEGADASGEDAGTPFPTFVVEFFSKRYGLRSLIDSTCWDVLFNVHALRREHLEVEIFARFLEEYYDPDDLLFFLYMRSVVQKEQGISFRSRWTELGRSTGGAAAAMSGLITPGNASSMPSTGAPAPVYLSLKECQHISRVVFGSEADPLYRTFSAMIERHMSNAPGARDRRIEVTQFLNLALVEYHETRPADEAELAGISASAAAAASAPFADGSPAGAPSEAQRLFQEAVAAYDDRQRGGAGSDNGDESSGVPAAVAAAGGVTALLRRNPKLVDDLGQSMHEVNVAYLDRLMYGASSLPLEVQAQIRAEVQKQLEDKVDVIFASTIKAAETGAPTGNAHRDALSRQFGLVLAAAVGDEDAAASEGAGMQDFCSAVLEQPDVKSTVEPLVPLLVQYAASRLQPGGAASS